MKRAVNKDYLLAIDVGTTKICVVAARRNERKAIEVLGVGIHPCSGLSANGIVDLDEIVESITKAARKALSQAPGVDIHHAFVGITGSFIQSQNTVGSLVLSTHGRSVNQNDVELSINGAVNKTVPKDCLVLHAIPRWFRLDDTPYIRDPIGMEGSMLEVDIHLIIGRQTILKNLKRCVTMAGFTVEELVSQSIAASESVLTEEEKKSGVALVDIGGETTSLLVYFEGSIYHSETLEIGGEFITRDINHYFQTPMENAENLKKYSGSSFSESVDPEEMLEVIRFKNRRTIVVKKRLLSQVIEARVEQILEEVMRVLRARDLLGMLFAGIVLTGGTALMDGIRDKAKKMVKRDIHIGYPNGVVGHETIISSPIYTSVIGLLHYGFERRDAHLEMYGTGMKRFLQRTIRWIQERF
jgi:cell division protein FtsA